MTALVIGAILLSVSLSALAQAALKHGMSGAGIQAAIGSGNGVSIVGAIVTSPSVIGGIALYGLGMLVWLAVLARVEVSQAYPFVGLGFLMTMALGHFLFGESITMLRLAGTLLVIGGVVLVASS